jgi:hypothetical protein
MTWQYLRECCVEFTQLFEIAPKKYSNYIPLNTCNFSTRVVLYSKQGAERELLLLGNEKRKAKMAKPRKRDRNAMTEINEKIADFTAEIKELATKRDEASAILSRLYECQDDSAHLWRLRDIPLEVWAAMSERECRALQCQRNPSRGYEEWQFTIQRAYRHALSVARAEYQASNRHLHAAMKVHDQYQLKIKAMNGSDAALMLEAMKAMLSDVKEHVNITAQAPEEIPA